MVENNNSTAEGIYIARLDMVIKPFWDENKFKYFDAVTWNEAIEKTISICKIYDRGFSTDAGMIRLKIMELKK